MQYFLLYRAFHGAITKSQHVAIRRGKQCLQEELRDEDLTALQVPVLFVKGTKDTFSTETAWKEVLSRMQSPRVEVAIVEEGDHSLSTKSGIGKQR